MIEGAQLSSSMAGDLIRKGAFVQICSLKRTEFNGRQGIVLGKHAGDEGKPARARVAMSFLHRGTLFVQIAGLSTSIMLLR